MGRRGWGSLRIFRTEGKIGNFPESNTPPGSA